jgi:hypothetical protein
MVNEGIKPTLRASWISKSRFTRPGRGGSRGAIAELPPRERLREPAGVEEEHREEDDQ